MFWMIEPTVVCGDDRELHWGKGSGSGSGSGSGQGQGCAHRGVLRVEQSVDVES
jgi:hypothetical protein